LHEPLTQKIVPLEVRCANELLEYWEMRRPVRDRRSRPWSIFNQHEPADKWARLFAESFFPVGRPQIVSRTDSLFGTVVEIVSEGWADMAFQLNCRDQFAFVDYEKVSSLVGLKYPGRVKTARCR